MVVLCASRVVDGTDILSPGWVNITDERIAGVGAGAPPADAGEVVQLPHGLLAPGLIDMQMNGAYGIDFAAADDDGWHEILRRLPSTGTTSVVPTFITAPVDDLVAGLEHYRQSRRRLDEIIGATRTLGVHIEGPFLAEGRRGAHDGDLLLDPTPEEIDRIAAAARDGTLAYLTLAPEREGGLAAVRRLTTAGLRVAVGHSDATDEMVYAAADAGATIVTHLYNAQRPLHHRDPGVVGAALSDDRLTCGMIVDCHHVHATAVRVAFRAARGRVALVTDAVSALGMPLGRYELGGQIIDITEDQPPLRLDGTIAGSALRMDVAVANAVGCGVELSEAIAAATRVPAKALGCDDIGRLEAGARADVVWLSDELTTQATWIAGALAYIDDDAHETLGGQLEATT